MGVTPVAAAPRVRETAPMACPVCGFDPTSISPADAVVALRSLPRRYREAAGLAGDQPDPGEDGPGDDDAGPGHDDGQAADRRALVLAQAAQATAAIAALGED